MAATLLLAAAALVLMMPLGGVLHQTGGMALVALAAAVVGLAALLGGYLPTARFQIHPIRRFDLG